MRDFIIRKEGWCSPKGEQENQNCKQKVIEYTNNLFGIYVITKTNDLHTRYSVFQDVAKASNGLLLNIDESFGQDLKLISANIIEATGVYYLKRLAQKGTLRVSWTWAPKNGGLPLVVPENPVPGFFYTPSTPRELVSHLRVEVPKVQENTENPSILEGFEYDYKGNFIRFYGTKYLPIQNAKLNFNYTPRSLKDAH